jgi:protein gp37
MNLKNQPAALVPLSFRPEIEGLSKAALMDIVWSFASRSSGQEGDPDVIMREFRHERDIVTRARKFAKGRQS